MKHAMTPLTEDNQWWTEFQAAAAELYVKPHSTTRRPPLLSIWEDAWPPPTQAHMAHT